VDARRLSVAVAASPSGTPAERLSIAAFALPDWASRSRSDPGITLVELLAYVAETLSFEEDQVANEAYLETARHGRLRVHISGRPALCVVADEEHAFVVTVGGETGDSTVRFGDDIAGERPPHGLENVTATYRRGAGEAGNLEVGGVRLRKPFVVVVAGHPRASARWFRHHATT
jgi:hypothetical protein